MFKNNISDFPENVRLKINCALECYYAGDSEGAFSELELIANKGNPEVYVFIAAFLEKGTDKIIQNYAKARHYYEMSLNEVGSVEAYLGLARIHLNGLGVEVNYCKAFEYYSSLMKENDDPLAHLNIGKMAENGMCMEIDCELAKEHFNIAWDNGYVIGLTYLGMLEQKQGHFFKGVYNRIKAGLIAFKIALNDSSDPRLRTGL